MFRYRIRHFLLAGAVIALPLLLLGVAPALQDLIDRMTALEADSAQITSRVQALEADSQVLQELVTRVETLEADPVLSDLITRVELIEEALFSDPIETVLLDDDFEDGIDPAWVQVNGTTQTIAPTLDCGRAYFSKYENCGSLGLHFDEVERYDYELPVPSTGSFSLYFHDDPADTEAAAFVAVLSPGSQERLGVATGHCPNHYYLSLNPGTLHHCTNIPRRVGWHRVEFVRTGMTTRGYLDRVLVFETNHPDRVEFGRITVVQEPSYALLDGFAIDDVRFVATGE